MDDELLRSLTSVCQLLNKHKIQYMVVGGTAVALYGYFRMSISSWGEPITKPDLDFWYNPTYENYFLLLNVLEELGEDVSAFRRETSPDPRRSFFRMSYDRFSTDFLPMLPGLSKFRDSYANKETADVNGVEVVIIGLDDLITNKQTLAREKDIADIDALRRLRANEPENE